jgi:arylsulfatase A-like enzyme
MAIFVQPPCASFMNRFVRLLLQASIAFAIACWFTVLAPGAQLSNQSRHVVVVVWDGLRPDFVSEENTPALWKLAREGITFRNQHSVYPSATMVNGTALVTGIYPGRSGIIANHVYRPDIDPKHAIDVEIPSVVSKGDELSGGKYISVPTIAELVQRAGGRSVIAAAKTVGLLLDRQAGVAGQLSNANTVASPLVEGERMKVRGSATPTTEDAGTLTLPSPLERERRTSSGNQHRNETDGAKRSVTLFAGKSLPADFLFSMTEKIDRFPSAHLLQDGWTTKALTEVLWKDGVPAVSVLWLGEPDLTQHEFAPGAPAALAAIKSADQNFAAVLAALDQRHARESTDVFVVSDHGFSTIKRSLDLRKILNDAGFVAKTESETEPKPGEIMLAGNGGSVLFYVIGHDEKQIRRLVEFLQRSDFAGVIFTKEPMEGTFGLAQVTIQNEHSPDIVMAFRWDDAKNQFGIPGMIDADWQRAAGKGTHATLSRFDMHNMLIAAGPDFRRGDTDDLPTGNIDLAPTILHILEIKPPEQLDGRILSEAMVKGEPATKRPKSRTETIDAIKDFPWAKWRQTLKISRVGSTIYLDEGNGTFEKR